MLAISTGSFDPQRGATRLAFDRWLDELAALPEVAVLVREKQLDDRALYELLSGARSRFPGTLLVSGRPDFAAAAGLEGVHLPSAGLPVAAVRRRFPVLLVGVSTHGLDEVARARVDGAHYATFGPVFSTPSKASLGPAQGTEPLAAACRLGLPVLALGGLAPSTAAEALAAGAHGVAGIRCLADRAAAIELLQALEPTSRGRDLR